MHELSIAVSMVNMATEEAAKLPRSAKLECVHLKLGRLSGVVKDALHFSWQIACEGTPVEGSRLEIEEVPVVVFCPSCGQNRTLDQINNFVCPSCDEPVSEVVSGRELQVTALEICEGVS